jgi:CRISPR-associated protein Csd1
MGMLLSEPPADDTSESRRLHDALKLLAAGRPTAELDLGLAARTRFHILGLAPNAARLSVRFWLDDSFDAFTARLSWHWQDLRIEPAPWRNTMPAVWRLLVKTTALQEKSENVPPLLAGEVMRAILAGTRYPRSLLAAVLIRLRAGDDPGSGWHAAVIRACLVRDARLRLTDPAMRATAQEMLVSLDRDDPHPAYQLGRLFAALELAQRQALGRLNATIRDRYFGAASATPASVFPLLLRGAQNHLGKLRKDGKGSWIERDIEEIIGRLEGGFPRSLLLEAQGRFVIGYYHQRRTQFAGRPAESEDAEEETDHDNV